MTTWESSTKACEQTLRDSRSLAYQSQAPRSASADGIDTAQTALLKAVDSPSPLGSSHDNPSLASVYSNKFHHQQMKL